MWHFRIGPVSPASGGTIPTLFGILFLFVLAMGARALTAADGNGQSGQSGQSVHHVQSAAQSGEMKSAPPIGPACRGGANRLCLGVKLVAYTDPISERPALSSEEAVGDFQKINSVWNQCNVGFQIDSYMAVRPSTRNLAYQTANNEDLTTIRAAYATDASLLIVLTGTWNRKGSLGSTAANAWTAMPGDGPYGAILEAPVATYPNIIAHELGHYMNLPHVSDISDLMNSIIYPGSASLTPDQCETARAVATTYWSKMLRT
jgi:hypothetical protein